MITRKINKNVLVMIGSEAHGDIEYYGLASDSKPTENVRNASIFYEMDTKKVFMFDAQNKVWIEQ